MLFFVPFLSIVFSFAQIFTQTSYGNSGNYGNSGSYSGYGGYGESRGFGIGGMNNQGWLSGQELSEDELNELSFAGFPCGYGSCGDFNPFYEQGRCGQPCNQYLGMNQNGFFSGLNGGWNPLSYFQASPYSQQTSSNRGQVAGYGNGNGANCYGAGNGNCGCGQCDFANAYGNCYANADDFRRANDRGYSNSYSTEYLMRKEREQGNCGNDCANQNNANMRGDASRVAGTSGYGAACGGYNNAAGVRNANSGGYGNVNGYNAAARGCGSPCAC